MNENNSFIEITEGKSEWHDSTIRYASNLASMPLFSLGPLGEFICQTFKETTIVKIFVKVVSWLDKKINKATYVAENLVVKVDTDKLKSYADRLQTVNNKLASVDNRLNSLYKSVSFFDWGKVLGADLKTSESSKVKGCMKYLNNTASAFEKAEQNIMNSLC